MNCGCANSRLVSRRPRRAVLPAQGIYGLGAAAARNRRSDKTGDSQPRPHCCFPCHSTAGRWPRRSHGGLLVSPDRSAACRAVRAPLRRRRGTLGEAAALRAERDRLRQRPDARTVRNAGVDHRVGRGLRVVSNAGARTSPPPTRNPLTRDRVRPAGVRSLTARGCGSPRRATVGCSRCLPTYVPGPYRAPQSGPLSHSGLKVTRRTSLPSIFIVHTSGRPAMPSRANVMRVPSGE